MGGMTTATALSRLGYKVLLLEQAPHVGGLTHSYSRNGFSWDVGLHYCGLLGRDQAGGRILDWLSEGAVEFRSIGGVYDVLHFPDGFDLPVACPAEAYMNELKKRFPNNAGEIDAYFEALRTAEGVARMLSAERSMAEPARSEHHRAHREQLERWCGRTTRDVVDEFISDAKLATILSSQWGTYGGRPSAASFGIHATIMGHYLEGAGYPVGGGAAIAQGLVPVIESAGGSARAATRVTEIMIEGGKAVGVRTSSGEEFCAPIVVSAIGASETVRRLLPPEMGEQPWAAEIKTFEPSVCHFEVHFGFEGDISRHGASRSNDWFFTSWDLEDRIWSLAGPIPQMFVSFPSLKNPAHEPGPQQRHTGQCMVLADWSPVARFAEDGARQRAAEWEALKADVEANMLAFFKARFPGLAPLIVHHTLSTPLATVSYTGHEKGGFYGVEATPRRMLSDALSAQTPVPGLFLSGQDILTPGIAGALFAGMLCAAAIDSRVYGKMV